MTDTMARANLGKSIGTTSWLTTFTADAKLPLHRQLYESIRDGILKGRLTKGSQVPSSRILMKDLGVSRNTVLSALEQLVSEGYLTARRGSGLFVSATLPEDLINAPQSQRGGEVQGLSVPFTSVADELVRFPEGPSPLQPFNFWLPPLERFPIRTWSRLMRKHLVGPDRSLMAYGRAGGFRPLREAIATHLANSRALDCDAGQVVITAGAQQGLTLVARVLLRAGDRVVVEDPVYMGAVMALRWAGAEVIPVPVDREGLDVEAATQLGAGARLAFVTPSRQFPLGMTMSVSRRLALLEWARVTGAWILEDDYDSEYRFSGRPVASLQGMDSSGRVIYMGTFSKVLFPSLRLGYLVLPRALVDVFAAARAWSDWHSPTLEQAVLADFFSEGHFVRHLRRMRSLYAHRHAVLLAAARRHLAGLLDVQPTTGGMFTVGWLPSGTDAVAAARIASEQGVTADPLQAYAAARRQLPPGLLLGFAAFDDAAIERGVQQLAAALRGSLSGPAD
jgi:GntR family transcriptional regulator/MocR family aminotransferase